MSFKISRFKDLAIKFSSYFLKIIFNFFLLVIFVFLWLKIFFQFVLPHFVGYFKKSIFHSTFDLRRLCHINSIKKRSSKFLSLQDRKKWKSKKFSIFFLWRSKKYFLWCANKTLSGKCYCGCGGLLRWKIYSVNEYLRESWKYYWF